MGKHKIQTTLLIALTLTVGVFAQEKPSRAPSPQFMLMRILQLQPGMDEQFRDFMKNEYIPAMKKAGVAQLYFLSRATFGEGHQDMVITPLKGISEVDSPAPLAKALGQEGAIAMWLKLGKFLSGSRTVGITTRPDLSIPPPSGYTAKLVGMMKTTIAPGRTADFEKYRKEELREVLKKTSLKGVLVSRVNVGGNFNEYNSAFFYDSFAEMEKFRAEFAKASEAAKLGPMPAGIVTHAERSMFRFVPELSIDAAPAR